MVDCCWLIIVTGIYCTLIVHDHNMSGAVQAVENWGSSHVSAKPEEENFCSLIFIRKGFPHFYAIAPVKMAVRLVFTAVHSAFTVSTSPAVLQLYLYLLLGCSVLSLTRKMLGEQCSSTCIFGGAIAPTAPPVPPPLHVVFTCLSIGWNDTTT